VLFGSRKARKTPLDREDALAARPVLNRLVKVERDAEGKVILQVPRRDNALVRTVTRWFQVPPYKKVALDELGTFVIELCDGEQAVRDIVDKLGRRFRLSRREAELSTTAFLRTLARRSIIGLLVESGDER
jgi:hypothetical protein